MYREELIKYLGWHDLFVIWRVVLQEDAGVPGGVDTLLGMTCLFYGRGCFRKTLVYREELIL